MSMLHPLGLCLLPLIALMVWFSCPADAKGRRRWPEGLVSWLLILRGAALVCLVLAMTGPALTLPAERQDLMVLIDVSDSQGPGLTEKARGAALTVVRGLASDSRATVLAFAGDARVIAGPGSPSTVAAELETASLALKDGSQTDIRAAFMLAASLNDRAAGTPVFWLFSDGKPTRGGGLEDLATIDLGGPLFAVPLGQAAKRLVSTGLEPPAVVRPGERALVRWSFRSPDRRRVAVRLLLDGEAAGNQTLELRAGEGSAELSLAVPDAGSHRLDLVVYDESGRELVPARISALVEVSGPARILVIHGDGETSPLVPVLRTQGMQVSEAGTEGLPADPAGLSGIPVVVLDNLPARNLSARQIAALQAHVAGGGGLLVTGGDSSLGRGDYWATALEELLPVQTDTRQRLFYNRTKMLFVVDHSGSMSDTVGAVSKLEAAMQGVSLAVDQLAAQDEVAVLTFDSEPTWQLDFTPASRKNEIRAALANLPTGGGTDMAKAMEEVTAAFGEPGPTRRHVVFLTDGQTENVQERFRAMADQLVAVGVSITTVGIGEDIKEDLLRDLATWGHGSFYRAQGDELPRILKQDTVALTRDLIQEGKFLPRGGGQGGLLAGLSEPLPAVNGYLVTRAKAQATVWLNVQSGASAPADPLLASWHYGSGQVAVFTADSGRRWLSDWTGRAVLNRFWTTLIRGLETGGRDPGLHLTVENRSASARVSVEALDAQRQLRSGLDLSGQTGGRVFKLEETAPGHYVASLPLDAGGLHSFRIADSQSGDYATAWTWNPEQAETGQGGSDLPGLGRLAAASGGALMPVANPGPSPRLLAWLPIPVGGWLMVLALVLVVVDLGLRSTLLGQAAMAKAVIGEWWRRQRSQARAAGNPLPDQAEAVEAADHDRVMDAYRYLALRAQQRSAAQAASLAADLARQAAARSAEKLEDRAAETGSPGSYRD